MSNIKYSQNFLNNKELVRQLIELANIQGNDYVIEIGPGKGIITDILSEYAKKITAIEFDKKLYDQLMKKNKKENIEYVYSDFLKYKLPTRREYKVFSNIPFQITADIIRKLTERWNSPEEIFLIVQKEAAKKYCGIPQQKYEGLRASILKLRYETKIIYEFAKSDFSPRPHVDTVLLHMKKKKSNLTEKDYNDFKDLVSFFYTCNKGNSAKDCLSSLFSNEQIKRMAHNYQIKLLDSYTIITSEQWEKVYLYSKIGLSPEKKSKIKGNYQRISFAQKQLIKQHRTSMRKNLK